MNISQESLTAKITSLPPLSASTLEITRLIATQDYRTGDLVKLIETDLTLSSRCLQMVNSPMFGLKGAVGTIQRAVVLLGSQAVANIAIATGMSKIFKDDLTGYQSTKEDFWCHGLRTAIASRLLCERLFPEQNSGIAYTAGLLHDVGKIVISDYLDAQYESFHGTRDQGDFLSIEQSLLGVDHAVTGAMVATKWNLPDPIAQVIRHHHRPCDAPEQTRELTLSVHLGDIFAMLEGFSTALDGLSYSIDPIAERYVKKDPMWEVQTYPKLLLEIDSEFIKAVNLSGNLGADDV